VRSLVATGNLVFEAEEQDPRALEARLEQAFAARFGRHVDIIARAGPDWLRLVAGNPFPKAAATEPERVAVRVMRAPLDPAVADRLRGYLQGEERLEVVEGDLWVHLPYGMARSRLAGAIRPERAGGAGTFRNWNTVRRLGAMLDG